MWKFYLPEKIRINYEENLGKDIENMDLKDFDATWFIGCLRSID